MKSKKDETKEKVKKATVSKKKTASKKTSTEKQTIKASAAKKAAATVRKRKAEQKKATAAKKTAVKKATTRKTVKTKTATAPKTAKRSAPKNNPLIQDQVTNSKYFVADQAVETFNEDSFMFPASYGDDKIVLMVRDPFWLHAYWEVTENTIENIRQASGKNDIGRSNMVLRVKDITGTDINSPSSYYDINIPEGVTNWYINVASDNRNYCVEIGAKDPSGEYYFITRSNSVTSPRSGVSDIIDEEWMYAGKSGQAPGGEKGLDEVYALSGGYSNLAASSAELREFMRTQFEAALSSGALSSFSHVSSFGSNMFAPSAQEEQSPGKQRDFFLVVDAELIVYGRTVPSASLTIQGKPKKLNSDGTFSARFALPVGNHEIPVKAVSVDGIDEITITPVVQRKKDKFSESRGK